MAPPNDPVIPSSDDVFERALAEFRERLAAAPRDPGYRSIVEARDDVLARFQPLFTTERVRTITADEVRSFLNFSENRHWRGLHRHGGRITQDMPALRDALAVLLDEARPLAERIDYASDRVKYLRQAIITPILLVAYPERYAVWNRVSQEALTEAGLWPAARGTLGVVYERVNATLLRLAKDLGVDLWTLDGLWWIRAGGPLPELRPGQSAWIEIGLDRSEDGEWGLGRCLWSPSRTKSNQERYELMRQPQVDDLVVHFLLNGGERSIAGWSRITGPMEERLDEPPDARDYAGQDAYYRVPLDGIRRFEGPPAVDDLIQSAGALIRDEVGREKNHPFSRYRDGVRLTAGQYLTRVTPALYGAIRELVHVEVGGNGAGKAPRPRAFAEVCSGFADALRQSSVAFGTRHDEVVRAFVASAAAKRFVILTGLSGSGKTQLGLKFGEWLGEGRLRVIPVRPDWTGPDSLLGYEDALMAADADGCPAWSVPAALEFIMKAAADPNSPYVLVLDEMNLAHVERYFADVLSAMESGQGVIPALRRDKGVWRVQSERALLPFPDNLFVIGTVNVDETTYMFSPKVLDRANTLEFRVATDALPLDSRAVSKPTACAAAAPELARAFLAIAREPSWHAQNPFPYADAFVTSMRRIHEVLTLSGDEFGHRTFYEGLRLASLLAAAGESTLEGALDVFVLQKILPRLHGARRKLEPVLQRIGAFAIDPKLDVSALESVDLSDQSRVAALPNSFAKTSRMLRTVRTNQFASFSD